MPTKPRARNKVKTHLVKISTTPQVVKQLDALVKTGYFGKTRTEVAEALLRDRLRDLLLQEWTKKKR